MSKHAPWHMSRSPKTVSSSAPYHETMVGTPTSSVVGDRKKPWRGTKLLMEIVKNVAFVVAGTLGALGGITVVTIGALYYAYSKNPEKLEFGFDLIAHVMTAVHSLDIELDADLLLRTANAAVKELDPHSYYGPLLDDEQAWVEELMSEDRPVGGVGILLHPVDKSLVFRVYPDSPADRAGVLEGDRLIELDQMSLSDLRYPQYTIDDRIFPRGADDRLRFVVERGTAELEFETTDGFSRATRAHDIGRVNGVPHIRVTSFDLVASVQVRDILRKAAETQPVASVLIDLRGNPGGYLLSAQHLANLFLPKESVVVHLERGGVRQETKRTIHDKMFPEIEQVGVIIDRNSASASEAFAALVSDHHLGPVAGETSYGKGSVQTYLFPEYTEGHYLHGTVQHYTGPDGARIHGIGVTPEFMVETREDGTQDWDQLIANVTQTMAARTK